MSNPDVGFAGRLFAPGLPGGGALAQAQWRAGELEIRVGEQAWAVPAERISAGGFNGERWRIDFEAPLLNEGSAVTETAALAFFLEDAAARAAFMKQAPAGLQPHIQRAGRVAPAVAWRFRLGWAFLILLLLSPFLALGWFLHQSDAIAAWVVDAIPVEQEKALGDMVLAQTRAQMRLVESGPAVDAVRQIGGALSKGSVHEYRWFVAEQKQINAFAAPGGVVVVFSGLIEAAKTAEELAGVLAHEVAHAELRHSLRATVKNLGLRGLLGLALGDWAGSMLGDAAAELTALKFSRDAEREADQDGLRRMVQAGFDPYGMVRFFELLAQENAVAPPAMLSTHPDSAERAQGLKAAIAALGPVSTQPIALDWGAVQRSLAEKK